MHGFSLEDLTRRYPALRPAICAGGVNQWTSLRAFALYISLPLIICLASHVDGTWLMKNQGKGFFQHYGMLTIFLTTPVIVILTAAALQKFVLAMESLHKYTRLGPVPPDLERLVTGQLESISLRKKSIGVFFVFSMVGLLFFTANIRQTIHPVATYGNDVFDSLPYPCGFYTTKIYLLLAWTLAYPAALFVALHITFSLVVILKHMRQNELLRIDFFHPDNCGGVSIFGSINLLVMAIYGNLFAVLYMLRITHTAKTYLTVTVPWILLSLVFIGQSFGAVYHIHKFASAKKNESLRTIGGLLEAQMDSLLVNKRFPADLMQVRNHLLGLNTYPYAKPALALVNTLRFALAPAMFALGKLLLP